jgi:hypothetical protein
MVNYKLLSGVDMTSEEIQGALAKIQLDVDGQRAFSTPLVNALGHLKNGVKALSLLESGSKGYVEFLYFKH